MSVSKFSKAGFVRELCKDGARWYRVDCGKPDSYDLLYVSERLNEIHENIRSGDIVDTRTFRNTSGTRCVSNNGSVLDVNKHDAVFRFEHGFILENGSWRWAYVAA